MMCLDKTVITSLRNMLLAQNFDIVCKIDKKLIVTKFQRRDVLDRTAVSKETSKWRNLPSTPTPSSLRLARIRLDVQHSVCLSHK